MFDNEMLRKSPQFRGSVLLGFLQLIVMRTPVSEGRLVLEDTSRTGYSASCNHWITSVRSARVIFCRVEPDDHLVKSIVSERPATLVNAKGDNRFLRSSLNEKLDFVLFMDSGGENHLETCISEAIPLRLLSHKTTMIICDKSPHLPRVLEEMESLKFLGLANTLYLTAADCWSATPFFFRTRKFSKQFDCYMDHWKYNERLRLPDMKGLTVRVVTFKNMVFSIIKENESRPEKRYDGIEVSIFKKAAYLLNLTWEIKEINDEDVWGRLLDGKWRGGVMEVLTAGDADVGLVASDNSINLKEYIDYTNSWATELDIFLAPRPHLLPRDWHNIFKSFSPHVWKLMVVSSVLFLVVAWTLGRLNEKFVRKNCRCTPLADLVLFTVGTLTAASNHLPSNKVASALLILSVFWHFFVNIMYVAYTSNIASLMSTTSSSTRIDSIKQLVELNFTWGRPFRTKPYIYKFYQNDWHKRWTKNFIAFNLSDQRHLIESRRFALNAHLLASSGTVVLFSPLDDDLVDSLRVVRDTFKEYRCTTILRKGSPLKPFYNKVINMLYERGVLKAIWTRSVWKYQKFSYNKLMKDSKSFTAPSPENTLNFDIFKYMLSVLVVGGSLSCICFILELLVHYVSKRLHSK